MDDEYEEMEEWLETDDRWEEESGVEVSVEEYFNTENTLNQITLRNKE